MRERPVAGSSVFRASLFRSPLLYTLIWAAVIFLLCNLRLDTSGEPAWYYFDGIDKVVHGGMFLVLAFLSSWGFYRQRRLPVLSRYSGWWALLLCIGYGGLIEVLQGTVFTYRSADWIDWLFDIGGALLGLWAFRLFKNQYLGRYANKNN